MSLLSSFIVKNIVKALEAQFISHVPELQQAFLNEVTNVVKVVTDWTESKINVEEGAPSNEKKGS
jgi:hypothetical protein